MAGHKAAEVASRTPEFMRGEATKPFGWDPLHWLDWATVSAMLQRLGVEPGARVVDVGCGSGWTTLFLAEAGYEAQGYDLVPANVELARRRAERWGSPARFEVADMEALPAGEPADCALVYDALHHSAVQAAAIRSIGTRVRPGGWLILGEPTWLHRLSPDARRTRREVGWLERGLTLRTLRRDLDAAGFAAPRRFFGPARPYERRVRGLAWQLTWLVAANLLVAPQGRYWLAARRR